jgi:hypothetical protein
MFLELVSIIINFIFFSSLICFNASLMRLRIESINFVQALPDYLVRKGNFLCKKGNL